MSIFEVKNGQLDRKDASALSQLTATDTDNITGGGAGEEVNAQALIDGITGELGTLGTDKQPKTLDTPITVDGASKTTVETALDGLNEAVKKRMTYAVNGVLGAKNLVNMKTGAVVSANGITFTVNDDGSVKVSGTATGGNATFAAKITLKPGKYTLTGAVNASKYIQLYLAASPWTTIGYDTGNGLTFTITAEATYNCQLVLNNGTTGDDSVFYPMIRLASDTDATYQPYAMTNKELTDALAVTDLSSAASFGSLLSGKLTSSNKKVIKYGKIVEIYAEFTPNTNISLGAWSGGIILNGLPLAEYTNGCNVFITVNGVPATVGGVVNQRSGAGTIETMAGVTLASGDNVRLHTTYLVK